MTALRFLLALLMIGLCSCEPGEDNGTGESDPFRDGSDRRDISVDQDPADVLDSADVDAVEDFGSDTPAVGDSLTGDGPTDTRIVDVADDQSSPADSQSSLDAANDDDSQSESGVPGEECPPEDESVFEGDYTIETNLDRLVAANYTENTSHLSIEEGLETVELPILRAVGSLRAPDNLIIRNLSLPCLQTVAGRVTFDDDNNLESLNLSRLETTGDQLSIGPRSPAVDCACNPLLHIQLPSLESVGVALNLSHGPWISFVAENLDIPGGISLTNAPALQTFAIGEPTGELFILHVVNTGLTSFSLAGPVHTPLPGRPDGHGVSFRDNPSLETIDVGVTEAEDVAVTGNESLASLEMSILASVRDLVGTAFGNVEVSNNPSLDTVLLGSLESISGDLTISQNDVLTTVSLDQLSDVGDVIVTDNPLLPACWVDELLARLIIADWDGSYTNSGNDETATCD